ncbi:MAG: hypothetical protein Q7S29_03215 [Candidatus Peribacter sp.]|nr:hypothetical protein [Candidatus Peribacter sp.]
MRFRRLALTLVVSAVFTLGRPMQTSAATWDFLFTDLSWPVSTNPVSGGVGISLGDSIGSSTDVGTQEGTSGQGSAWNFLFTDLSWPEANNPVSSTGWGGAIGSFAETGMSTGVSSGGFWSYLFTDLQWPEESFTAIAGFGE